MGLWEKDRKKVSYGTWNRLVCLLVHVYLHSLGYLFLTEEEQLANNNNSNSHLSSVFHLSSMLYVPDLILNALHQLFLMTTLQAGIIIL